MKTSILSPDDRIAKGKKLKALSRARIEFIEQENEKDATVILFMLLGMGGKLKAVRWEAMLKSEI